MSTATKSRVAPALSTDATSHNDRKLMTTWSRPAVPILTAQTSRTLTSSGSLIGGLGARKRGALVLNNGASFEGWHFGANQTASGHVVFSTAMTGYPESMTDPSYCDQILNFTYPLVGNYGVPSGELDQ